MRKAEVHGVARGGTEADGRRRVQLNYSGAILLRVAIRRTQQGDDEPCARRGAYILCLRPARSAGARAGRLSAQPRAVAFLCLRQRQEACRGGRDGWNFTTAVDAGGAGTEVCTVGNLGGVRRRGRQGYAHVLPSRECARPRLQSHKCLVLRLIRLLDFRLDSAVGRGIRL